MAVTFTLNGKARPSMWIPRCLFCGCCAHAEYDRDEVGCGVALCGACTVHIDGEASRSCITPVSSVEERRSPRSKSFRRRLPPRSESVDRRRCAAMRVLPIGADHVCRGIAARNRAPRTRKLTTP